MRSMTHSRSLTAYDVAVRLDAAHERHPGLDWVVTPNLDVPYMIEDTDRGPKVYLNGAMTRTLADAALLAAVDELDAELAEVTCLSCGAAWGEPHAPGCQFSGNAA